MQRWAIQRWQRTHSSLSLSIYIYPVPVFAYVDHNKLFRRRNGRLMMDRRWIRAILDRRGKRFNNRQNFRIFESMDRCVNYKKSNNFFIQRISSRGFSLRKKNSNEHYAEYRGRRSGACTGFIYLPVVSTIYVVEKCRRMFFFEKISSFFSYFFSFFGGGEGRGGGDEDNNVRLDFNNTCGSSSP